MINIEKIVKSKLIAGIVLILSGVTHIIEGLASVGLTEISVTALIYGVFFLLLGLLLPKIKVRGDFDANKRIFVFINVISFLNACTNMVQLIFADVEQRYFLYGFMIWHIIAAIIIFRILFKIKTTLEQMDSTEKKSYFSILLVKGLGLNYLFQMLAWLVPLNSAMVLYFLIFGTINSIIGELLSSSGENKKVQILGIVIPIISGTICIVLVFYYFVPNLILFAIFHIIVIIIRIAYLKKKF